MAIRIQTNLEKTTNLEKVANQVKEKFRIKTKGLSFASVRSLIANKMGDQLSTAYYDYLHIMSGKFTVEEIVEDYYKKASNLGII